LRVVNRGELRIKLTGRIRRLDQLSAQGAVTGFADRLVFAVGISGFTGSRGQPGKWALQP
jgi:hypothetical protein